MVMVPLCCGTLIQKEAVRGRMGKGMKINRNPSCILFEVLLQCLASQSLSCANAESPPDLCTPLRHELKVAEGLGLKERHQSY